MIGYASLTTINDGRQSLVLVSGKTHTNTHVCALYVSATPVDGTTGNTIANSKQFTLVSNLTAEFALDDVFQAVWRDFGKQLMWVKFCGFRLRRRGLYAYWRSCQAMILLDNLTSLMHLCM